MEFSNLGYAAYLMLRGFKLLEPPTRGIDGKFIFKFKINEERNQTMFHSYSTGDFSKFDSNITNLKKMIPRY